MGGPKKCCVKGCTSTTNVRETSFHEIPSNKIVREKWIKSLKPVLNSATTAKRLLVCGRHFEENLFKDSKKLRMLKPNAVPTIFNIPDPDFSSASTLPTSCSRPSQKNVVSQSEYDSLNYNFKALKLKYDQLLERYHKTLSELTDLKVELKNRPKEYTIVDQVLQDAEDGKAESVFLLDQIRNYSKKRPTWSETTIRHCTIWRYASPKGYEFPRRSICKLPSRATIKRYVYDSQGNTNLISQRLLAEASILPPPAKLCSLIIDDMAVKERIVYSRTEDKIFGLDTTTPTKIGERPNIANKMLCFVIHGLTTKYTIPVAYHFHKKLDSKMFYKLTLNVLKLVHDCGFTVLRIVTDNHKSNVTLFKIFGNGQLKVHIEHPFTPHIPLDGKPLSRKVLKV